MPVIVVGADTATGRRIVNSLLTRGGEVRAFVSDAAVVRDLKRRGVKVAIGDVSDGSHIGGAALNAFTAVLVAEATDDGRERSFAADPSQVVANWAEGLEDAGVTRAIWLGDQVPAEIAAAVTESVAVPDGPNAADTICELDDRRTLP